MRASLLFCVCLAAAGCVNAPSFDPAQPRRVDALHSWDVVDDQAVVGHLTLLRMDGPEERPSFYRVTNAHGQWLGFIDRQGRVYQRVPFAETELFRGMHPLPQALRILCGRNGDLRLRDEGAEPDGEVVARPAVLVLNPNQN